MQNANRKSQSNGSAWAVAGSGAAFLAAGLLWAAHRPVEPLAIADLASPARAVPRFGRVELEFNVNREFANPFDPDEIDIQIEIESPDGVRKTHPAFWDVPHQCVLDHGCEDVRRLGQARWKVRVTPMKVGRHRWTVTARSTTERASVSGEFICKPSDRPGFVRVSESDSRYLEFSNATSFFPVGHCTRSPIDDRWRASDPGSAPSALRYAAAGTFAYAEWFRKMHDAGENLCSIWMAPWWCGLEWTPTRPGYDGIGRYNQKNAARMDHLIELAEQHGINVVLFAMNHGSLSSFMDGEWRDHPYNSRHADGIIEFASDFFEDERVWRRYRNLMRYLVARWGYSPAVAVWSLSTEIDWVEAYQGKRGDSDGTNTDDIPTRRDRVVRWVRRAAQFLKAVDAHPHIVSAQVCEPYLGDDIWSVPETEIVLTNAYTHLASNMAWRADDRTGTRGAADSIFVFGKKFENRNKPVLIAEWGGTVTGNRPSQLTAELHCGLWSACMADLAGITGFWWWNAVDKDGLYSHFRAVKRFAEGEDRRGKNYDSKRAAVLMEFSPFSEEESPLYAPHPRQSALALFNEDSLRAYSYCREINDPQYARPAKGFDDATFPESGPCLLELPKRLSPGKYHVEYWNTFTGEIFLTSQIAVSPEGRRLLPLPSHRVDLAVKVNRVGD